MKKLVFCLLILNLFSLLFGETEKLRLGVLNGPSAVPAAWIMENSTDVEVTKYADPQALLPKLIKKEIDAGFLPANVAAKVYNSTNGEIICAAVTCNGNLSVISSENIKRFSDLKNQTVYIAGQGATPEFMFRYLLEQNGISTENKQIILDFSIPTSQLAANIIAGKIKYAVVPEPFATIATSKSNNVKVVLDLQDEYEATGETTENYPMTVMVVRKNYIIENANLFNSFLEIYEKSTEWTIKNPKTCGKLVEKHDLGLNEAVVTRSIPKSNYVYIPAVKAQKNLNALFEIFLKYDSKAIGSNVPDSKFYYDKEAY